MCMGFWRQKNIKGTPMSEQIVIERADGVLNICLNRPDKKKCHHRPNV